MIKAEQLTRRYGDFLAVDRVDFSIGQGEIVGLLGHNGAGKTTIMKMLTGYLEPSGGRILVDDIDVAEQPKVVQRSLGYLSESLPLYPEMTVVDYLEYAAELRGVAPSDQANAVRESVEATELEVEGVRCDSHVVARLSATRRGRAGHPAQAAFPRTRRTHQRSRSVADAAHARTDQAPGGQCDDHPVHAHHAGGQRGV